MEINLQNLCGGDTQQNSKHFLLNLHVVTVGQLYVTCACNTYSTFILLTVSNWPLQTVENRKLNFTLSSTRIVTFHYKNCLQEIGNW